MALLAAACRKSVPWLNCGWLLPVDGGGDGGGGDVSLVASCVVVGGGGDGAG